MFKKVLLIVGLGSLLIYKNSPVLGIAVISTLPLFISVRELYTHVENHIIQYSMIDNDDEYYACESDTESDSTSSSSSSSEDELPVPVPETIEQEITDEYIDYPQTCDYDQILYYLSNKLPQTEYKTAVRILNKIDPRVELTNSDIKVEIPDKFVIPVNTDGPLISSVNDVAHFYCI